MAKSFFPPNRFKVQFVGIVMSFMLCSAQLCSASPPKPRPVPHPVYRPYPVRPLGAPIHIGRAYPVLPLGYVAFMVSGALFYSHAGNYYRRTPAGYVVIADPTHGAPRQQVVLSENRKVITRALNVRNGPGVQNAIISTVHMDTVLSVIGKAPGWFYVQLPNGTLGWVMAKYTIAIGQPTDG